jgi:hypothetical protein
MGDYADQFATNPIKLAPLGLEVGITGKAD